MKHYVHMVYHSNHHLTNHQDHPCLAQISQHYLFFPNRLFSLCTSNIFFKNSCGEPSTPPIFTTILLLFSFIAFGYNVSVLEAEDDWHYNGNSPFCMDDFKDRKAPILVIDPTGEEMFYSLAVNKEELYGVFI